MHNISIASDSLIYGHYEYGNADMEKVVSTPAVLTHKREMGCQERSASTLCKSLLTFFPLLPLTQLLNNILKMLTDLLQDIKGCPCFACRECRMVLSV